jgi:Fe-S-cluster containining protein
LSDEVLIRALKDRSYFFDHGIRFACRRCGACCNGEPGVIYVLEEEIARIAGFVDISRKIFIERCMYPFQDSYSIREDESGRCIFYENGCAIYPVRPLQCRTFPFWFHNLRSLQAWQGVAKKCAGIGTGRLYTKEEIFAIAQASCFLFIAMQDLLA